MAQKMFVFCLTMVCITVITLVWLTRGSLCELHVKQGGTEIVASLACEPAR
ncbi:Hok/Gef family protein [Erwiniaceae bacterium CMYE1]|nr:Hok/Gef family protein [Erwinia phyllosphaerae]